MEINITFLNGTKIETGPQEDPLEINITFLNGPEIKIDPQVGPQGATGPQGLQGPQGPQGNPGADGFSPTFTVTDITGGHRVTITDATGPHSFDVMDGSNQVTTNTVTDISGILKGNGSTVRAAVAGMDYISPTEDANNVKVTEQTFTDAKKAQARSNIDAANAKHYKDNGIEIVSDGAGNIDPDNMSIVLCMGDQYSVMEYSAVASIILGPGRFNCRNALALGGNSIFLDSMFTDHPWLQQYCEPYPLEQYPNAYRLDAAIDQKKVGNVVIGTCRSTNFGFMYGNMCVATGGWGFTAGQYNYNKHNMCALFGNALISGNHSSLVCGRWNNPLSTDRFEVGNGTGVNSRSNAFRVTNDGKAIAQNVLAIEDGNGGLIELTREQLQAVINAVTKTTVTGTTPTINALPGVRYVCGEVATLDITLPASGVVDVTFESGSTATVLTITPPTGVTVRWANGFDPTSLEADTTYEINICDGFGVAASWT